MATPVRTYHLAPYGSHMSLFLGDRENRSEVDYSGWHRADVAGRRVLGTVFELQIATARYDVVPVRLRLLNEAPLPNLAADHVVEDGLQVPSGKLVLDTVVDEWNEVSDIPVAPGLPSSCHLSTASGTSSRCRRRRSG